ncbi:hypothetical protein NM680_11655 [Paracoccus sp. PS-1]|uniref:hypothetical protein n=1 Tax=Paracoccus sp. PS1 TaxID=2963938 RepID=UPI0027E47C5D|nr:hypothetical protein [Paracoccus sp. PS1]MDQ7262449.1 hypothetical protein [Paracoccus sp. PS1]
MTKSRHGGPARTPIETADLCASGQVRALLITERDEALVHVAAAYEAAARRTESEDVEYPSGVIDMEGEELREILRALTPADARAALEAYGREKVREGMRRAAEICDDENLGSPRCNCRLFILAEMEKDADQ